jgi:hypothetical protein
LALDSSDFFLSLLTPTLSNAFFFIFWGEGFPSTWNQTQGLMHARKMLYN